MRMLAVFIFVIPTLASAGWINRSGETLSDTDASKAVGDFGAELVFVADERELLSRWEMPSESVDVKTVSKVATNGFINAFIIFGGCKADANGNCSVVMRFHVLQPDGKVYIQTPAMEVWQGKRAPAGKSLELSVQYLKIRIEPNDQLGQYTIQTQVKDENSGATMQLKSSFVALHLGDQS
jgi:hypothetical protein